MIPTRERKKNDPQNGRKYLQVMICEGLVSRKYEEFSQFNNKMINKPI